MNKRIAAAILWFFAGCYLGGYIALMIGISDAIGPILGIAAAATFAGDPLGIIWPRRQIPPVAAPEPERLEDLAQAA